MCVSRVLVLLKLAQSLKITCYLEANKQRPQPKPRLPNTKSKGKLPETDFFINSRYIIPWNRIRSMWITYFGLQKEFPEGVGIKNVRNALKDCMRYMKNPGVNLDEITEWKERFEEWISQSAVISGELGNYDINV